MGIFGPRPGSWWMSSEKDPRWDANGRCANMVITAGIKDGIPELHEKMEELKKLYGEPPDDLEVGGMKD